MLIGLQSGRNSDKFHGVQTSQGITGSPLLEDALLWMECRVEASLDTGDRIIYLAEVVNAGGKADDTPLRLKRLLQLLTQQQRDEFQRLTANDITLDIAAIRAWRVGKEGVPDR